MKDTKTPTPTVADPGKPGPLVLRSEALFGPDRREVLILHAGRAYRLRLTRQNKLILTK